MTPLAELLKLLEHGQSTLAWSMEHAPDGDMDAALKRSWDAEPNWQTLEWCVCMAHKYLEHYGHLEVRQFILFGTPKVDYIKRHVPCPAWAEITLHGRRQRKGQSHEKRR